MKPLSKIDTFNQLITLEEVTATSFIGVSPEYQWGRVYGGQVVAQGLAAAQKTIDSSLSPHSIHAYFIRSGTFTEDINYQVDCLRDGKSFATRRVVANQSEGAILNLSASFQVQENGVDIQEPLDMSSIPRPETLESDDWSNLMNRRVVPVESNPYGHGVWLRLTGERDSGISDELGIAYTSDDVPFVAAIRLHPTVNGTWGEEADSLFFGASLDHAIWFHRPQSPYAWQLHIHQGITHVGNRGLAIGKIYAEDGVHVATVVQEILQRVSR